MPVPESDGMICVRCGSFVGEADLDDHKCYGVRKG